LVGLFKNQTKLGVFLEATMFRFFEAPTKPKIFVETMQSGSTQWNKK
jgi:hypothetical protein